MILRGSIKTTEEKAKSVKGDLEKLVTKAKKQKKSLLSIDLKPFEVEKMLNEIGPSFANRSGGYTRIIKTGKRFNDNASMVILQWVDRPIDAKALMGKEEVNAVTNDMKVVKTKKASPKKVVKKTVKKEDK